MHVSIWLERKRTTWKRGQDMEKARIYSEMVKGDEFLMKIDSF